MNKVKVVSSNLNLCLNLSTSFLVINYIGKLFNNLFPMNLGLLKTNLGCND